MTNMSQPAEQQVNLPKGTLLLLAVTLGAMATQIVVPGLRGVAVADLLAGVSFAAVVLSLWRQRAALTIPAPLPPLLLVYGLANLFARSSKSGMVEVAQRIEFLFCGVLILGVLLALRPKWARAAVGWALAASMAVALVQGFAHGFGSTIPPKDVTELTFGFGGKAFTGLFRSRMALGLFVGAALAWLQPGWFAGARSAKHWLAIVAATALTLGFVAHGQLLLLAGTVLVLFGFVHSWKAGLANLAALALLGLSLAVGGRGAVLRESLSPVALRPGDAVAHLKPGHVELLAAARLASQHPLRGVGAGDAYQRNIGTAYGSDLPAKSLENDTETDSQSGYGILFATVGYPAGLLLVATLLAAVGLGIGGFLRSEDAMALGGAGVLALALGGMWITDPFTKGNAWMVALALAGCWRSGPVLRLTFARTVGWCVAFAAVGVLILGLGGAKAGEKKVQAPVVAWDSAAFGGDEFVLVVDAAEATEVAKPMVRATDSLAAKGSILQIPDKTCTPPDEASVGMKYGGATFAVDIPEDMTAKIWLRVWWDGSCGNTVYVRVGEKGKLHSVGNDGTYDKWHWLATPPLELKQGRHTVFLLNREDGIRFDQMLVTDSMDLVPQHIETNRDEQ